MHQRIFDAVQISPHWRKIGTQFHNDVAARQRRIALGKRGLNDVADLRRREIQFKFSRLKPRHLRRFFDEPVQPVALFINDRQQFARLLRGPGSLHPRGSSSQP